MYFEIDNDERVIIYPETQEDLERLEKVYTRVKHHGLQQFEIVTKLPDEQPQRFYEGKQQHIPDTGDFGFSQQSAYYPVYPTFPIYGHYPSEPFWADRYGYNAGRGYNRSGEYGERQGGGARNERGGQNENPRDTGGRDMPRR